MFLAGLTRVFADEYLSRDFLPFVPKNMAKTESTKRRKRQRKDVTSEVVEEDRVNNEGQLDTVSSNEEKEEAAPAEDTEMKQGEEATQDEQDSQVDTVIEVTGCKSNVTVSWDKKNEEGEADELEKRTNMTGQMTVSEEAPSEQTETNIDDQMQESGEPQMDNITGESAATVTVTWKKKNEDSHIKEETSEGEPMVSKETAVKGKRKAQSATETSPLKKTKLINDGFCLFVANLNNSKTYEEVKDALSSYLMTQSLLVQDIRLDRSKKHAHVDLASQMDLTKALTLNGEMFLDKPIKVEKAKIKHDDEVKVKASSEDKKAKRDAKCLFLKNVPFSATKEDILKIFRKAVEVRFPGGTEGPTKGIAFVEFKNKTIAKKVQQKRRVAKLQGRVLIVDFVGEANRLKVAKANDNNNNTEAAAPPNNTLFVSNLSYNVNERILKKVFQKAVSVTIPQSEGKSRGFAFIEFATVADAEKAFQSSQDMKLSKRKVRVQFYKMQEKSAKTKVLSKTLIVMGLAEKTSAETLKDSFEGALSARVIVDKETGVSKRFGFVDFESDENCKAAKDAMEDCEIDGSKVTVAYAKAKVEETPPGPRGGPAARPADQKAVRGGRGGRGGRSRGAAKRQDAVKEVGN